MGEEEQDFLQQREICRLVSDGALAGPFADTGESFTVG